MERDLVPKKDVCDFGYGTGRTVSQPFTGHFCAIFQVIKRSEVDGRFRNKIEDDDRHSCTANDRENRG
jgi:hypothetical protein